MTTPYESTGRRARSRGPARRWSPRPGTARRGAEPAGRGCRRAGRDLAHRPPTGTSRTSAACCSPPIRRSRRTLCPGRPPRTGSAGRGHGGLHGHHVAWEPQLRASLRLSLEPGGRTPAGAPGRAARSAGSRTGWPAAGPTRRRRARLAVAIRSATGSSRSSGSRHRRAVPGRSRHPDALVGPGHAPGRAGRPAARPHTGSPATPPRHPGLSGSTRYQEMNCCSIRTMTPSSTVIQNGALSCG